MKTFKQHILLEGSTEAAKEMEYVLVDAAGGDSGKTSYPNLKKVLKDKEPLDLGKEILNKVDLLDKGNCRQKGELFSNSHVNKIYLEVFIRLELPILCIYLLCLNILTTIN